MRHLRLTESMLDALGALMREESPVLAPLALICRKPYAGDPQRGTPPTPPDEVGLVRDPKARRLPQAALAESTGVARRQIGAVPTLLR